MRAPVDGGVLALGVGLGVVRLVPVQIMVQQVLVRAQQEGAGAAGGVEDAERAVELGRLGFVGYDRAVLQELTDRLLDDVVHDVSGRVEDAAGLLDFGLVLDAGMMTGGSTENS